MIKTRHIQPPETGPKSDPLLFGVAEALSSIFPIDERHFPRPSPARASKSPDGSRSAAADGEAAVEAPSDVERATA